MHGFVEAFHHAARDIGVAAEIIGIGLVPSVLVRRKEPASTIAWILSLVFLPALGAALFLLFGRDRVRNPAARKRRADAVVRARVVAASERRHKPDDAWAQKLGVPPKGIVSFDADELETVLFRVATSLTNAPPRGGNRVEVFTNGAAAYEAIGRACDEARHHIHAEYYLIRNDETGRWFRERLARAAARGVEVRLLCDGFGCLALPPSWFSPLHKAGVQVARFLPMHSVFLQPINLRNHRKIVVVDGEISFTGGLNIGDEYKGTMRKIGVWRDVHLGIRGPISAELQRVFFQDWAFATGHAPDPSDYFDAPPAGDATVAVVPSGPDVATEAIHRLFFCAIVGAKERIRISTPYFVPDQALTVALELAALRGVRVDLILPSRSNHKVTYHAGRSFYETLLDAGVNVYEFSPGIVHAKVMLVDESVCLVGSANMDLRSFRLNFEAHMLVHDPHAARALHAQFEEDLARSERIDLTAWRARPRSLRVLEGAARLVSPLL